MRSCTASASSAVAGQDCHCYYQDHLLQLSREENGCAYYSLSFLNTTVIRSVHRNRELSVMFKKWVWLTCWNVSSLRTEPTRVYLAHCTLGLVGHLIILNLPLPSYHMLSPSLCLKTAQYPREQDESLFPHSISPLCVLPKPTVFHLPPHGIRRNGLPFCQFCTDPKGRKTIIYK